MALHIVARLADFYVEGGYAADPESFKAEHFRPMYADATMHATNLEQQLYARQQDDQPITFPDLLRLSCAYCIEAIRADDSPNLDETWIFVSYAQYWLGVASGSRLVIGAGELALSENAKAGSRARDVQRGKVRALARQIATSRPFPNKTAAARAARADVLALAKTLGVPISEDRVIKSIIEWLEDIPFTNKQHP